MNTCSYHGSMHFCRQNQTAFISRYRNTNDYCVSGHRVSLSDDGQFNGTPAELTQVYQFELARYAEYLDWRAARPYLAEMPIQAFANARFAAIVEAK